MWSFGVILYIILGGYPPFHDENQQRLFKKIEQGVYAFHPEYWNDISQEAKDLIVRLLDTDMHRRYTVDQALAHPWVQAADSLLLTKSLATNLAELKKFQAGRKWKAGVKAIMAVNKMKKLTSAFAKSTKVLPHTLDARYELGKKLGEGGYAVVKMGVNKHDQSLVAVKILDRSKMDEEHQKGLRHEVSILQALSHPNIVKALDFFEEPERFYVVMECINGGELFDRIVKKTCYTEKEARDLTSTLLKALKYLHDKNFVHRDLKPENLLLTSEENDADVKIVDFGFATEVDGENLTSHCGTPGYIAPEILKDMHYGKTVDMWSFGVILYILLGGYPPFYDKNQQMLFRKIMKGVYQFHEDYWKEVSEDAKDLISKLLVVDPAQRLTVDQALAHPWLQTSDERVLTRGLSQLRIFQGKKKLRAGIQAIITVNRMKKLVHMSKLAAIPESHEGNEDVDEDQYSSAISPPEPVTKS